MVPNFSLIATNVLTWLGPMSFVLSLICTIPLFPYKNIAWQLKLVPSGLIAILFISIGIYFILTASIEIQSPKNDENVLGDIKDRVAYIVVEGRTKKVSSSNMRIYILTHRVSNKLMKDDSSWWFDSDAAATINPNTGEWKANVKIGRESEPYGTEYGMMVKLIAVAATEEDMTQILKSAKNTDSVYLDSFANKSDEIQIVLTEAPKTDNVIPN